MTTSTYAPADQQTLQDAVALYEGYRNVPAGHFITNPAVDDNGTHLHLADPSKTGRKFYGIAVPGPEGVRITKTDNCPLCHDKPAPTRGHVVRYGQIGAVR